MCGITGVISKSKVTQREYQHVLKNLMLNEARGKDSAGLVIISPQGVDTYKDAITPAKFVEGQIENWNDNMIGMIGHTRFATVGEKTTENAHPFTKGSIVGVHNGHVTNYRVIGDYKVDSEAIFDLLNDYDGEPVATFKQLRGAFAIAWVNLKNMTINLVRDTNPCFILETDNAYFFDSQMDSLLGTRMELGGEIYALKPNLVISFYPDTTIGHKVVEFDKYVYTPVPPVVTTLPPGRGRWNGYDEMYEDRNLFSNLYRK